MRYVLAILALAASGVLLLLGIGQRTFLAGPSEITYPIKVDAQTNYAVIDGEEFARVPGQANLVLRGEDAFAAIAKTRDIEGWVAPFEHQVVTVNPTPGLTEVSSVPGASPVSELLEVDDEGEVVPLDPRGSDLWLDTAAGKDGVVRLPIALSPNQAVLIAGSPGKNFPTDSSLVWVQDNSTPWAGPLFVAGGAFALLGIFLYLLAFDRDKRALGPRRGRKGPLLGVRNVLKSGKLRKGEGSEMAPVKGALSDSPEAIERLKDHPERNGEEHAE